MYKVLIADDETDTRNLLVKYIQRKEVDIEIVGSVGDGAEALDVAEKTGPDIVITDIFMPIMNGLEFLKEAQKRGIMMKAVVISGYDEFEYAKEAISLGVTEYLLKPFSPMELKKVLDKLKKELDSQRQLFDNMKQLKDQVDSKNILLKEKMLREIVEGKYNDEPPVAFLDVNQDYYCICLLKLPLNFRDKGWDFNSQENVDELLKIIDRGYFHKDVRVDGLSFDSQGAILILSGMASTDKQFLYKIRKGIDHLQESLEKYYSIKIMCVIGGIYDIWLGLSDSYKEAMELWRGLFAPNQMVIVYGEATLDKKTEKQEDAANQIKILKEQVLLTVRMGQEKKAEEIISELMRCYASLSSKKADYVSVSVKELVYAISNDMENQGLPHDDYRLEERLNNSSLLDIQAVLKDYIERCCQLVTVNREKCQVDRLVEDAKYIMESNLAFENLSLEWLSARLNFSPEYVRKIFKQKTGENFMEYLIRKRMEKAGMLLTKTDMLIQEVAEVCGYSNQRYFASSFKKYYDCTPTKFKTMMIDNNL